MGEPIAPEIEARIGKLVAEASMRVTEKAKNGCRTRTH